MDYYACKCCSFNDEFELCAECSKWLDSVGTTIEKHINEFKPVVHVNRWLNRKNKQTQK